MIEVKDLTIRAGDFRLERVSFRVPEGAYAILMGKTGSGKTTLLEAVCGLRPVEGGSIRFTDRDVTRAKPAERAIGYVPQDKALFPTLNVWEHLAFALKFHKWKPAATQARVEELGELLGITHLLSRKPNGLSGGESQRVALGRALSFRPQILCLDEPLSALDDETKEDMYVLLKEVSRHEKVTTLHVTHSLEEAKRLGTRMLRIREGVVEEGDVHQG